MPTPTPALAPFAAEAIRATCLWPPGTVLSFSGWATLAELGLPDRSGRFGSTYLVFALVSRDRISQATMGGGPPIVGRGICTADEEGWGTSIVPDDWRPPSGP